MSDSALLTPIPIYRIYVYAEGSNAFAIARDERWELKHEIDCESEEEAKDYVRQRSRQLTVLPNFIQSWRETPEEERKLSLDALIDDFASPTRPIFNIAGYLFTSPILKSCKIA